MSNEETIKRLGKLITGDAYRDAVHVAVLPAEAGERLIVGEPVAVYEGKAISTKGVKDAVGIVDPFLTERWVSEGERFYVWLFPGSVTSLRHEWTAPGVDGNPKLARKGGDPGLIEKCPPAACEAESRRWMEAFAVKASLDFDEVMKAARGAVESGDYLTQYGFESARDAYYDNVPEFWHHYGVLTGTYVDPAEANTPFSCSC